MSESWTHPTPENVRIAREEFDSWRDNPDPALAILFAQYPKNTDFNAVFLKVTALNATYSTQIRAVSDRTPTIYDVARHIVALKIDDELEIGSPEIVAKIADVRVDKNKHQYNFSFASKYCSWHRPDSYPIYDSRVDAYLWQLRNRETGKPGGFRQFKRKELWYYPSFKQVVIDLRTHFHLDPEEFSFKAIDKFLYVEGGKLFQRAKAPIPDADHFIQSENG